MLELVHSATPKILTDLLERRPQERKTVLEGEYLAEEEGQLHLHSLTYDADRVGIEVFGGGADESGVVSAEVMKEDWDSLGIVVAEVAG